MDGKLVGLSLIELVSRETHVFTRDNRRFETHDVARYASEPFDLNPIILTTPTKYLPTTLRHVRRT